MSITTLAYWKGGRTADMIAAARKSKAAFIRHGASDYRVGRVYAGPAVGLWEVAVTYTDWEAYGKTQQALAGDADYQALHDQILGTAEFAGRRIVIGHDL